MALRNCFEQRLTRESSIFSYQHMSAHGAKTSFVGVELNSDQLFSRSIIQTYTNIRMSIIAGGCNEFAIAGSDRFIPSPYILRGTRVEVCKHQIGITSIRPDPIKEHHYRI